MLFVFGVAIQHLFASMSDCVGKAANELDVLAYEDCFTGPYGNGAADETAHRRGVAGGLAQQSGCHEAGIA